MKIKLFPHNFKRSQLFAVLAVSFLIFSTQSAFAVPDYVRDTAFTTADGCQTAELKFFDALGGDNPDLYPEADNPSCIAYTAVAGVSMYATQYAVTLACNSLNVVKQAKDQVEIIREWASKRWLTNKIVKRLGDGAIQCSVLVGQCVGNAGLSPACIAGPACCASLASYAAAFGVAIGELRIIWQQAVNSQKNAHICGANWNVWDNRYVGRSNVEDTVGIPDYRPGTVKYKTLTGDEVEDYMYVRSSADGNKSYQEYLRKLYNSRSGSVFDSTYQEYLSEAASSHSVKMSSPDYCATNPTHANCSRNRITIQNKYYREFIYGGMEFEDNGGDDTEACKNPTGWSKGINGTRMRILGFDSDLQRYYMRGPGNASNYACGRFLLYRGTEAEKRDAKVAYDCCKERSQETICIEDSRGGAAFCKVGTRCYVRGIWYSIHTSKTVQNHICATTYSVCPYNHNLGGGTEAAEYDENYPEILSNHCQYLKHCVKIPDVPYIRTSNLSGGWISSACFNMAGDSQNEYEYEGSLTPINKTKHFSAPIVQCFKETLENVFTNRAGNTKCIDSDEEPDDNNFCKSGYNYKEGEIITDQKSFFQIIQEKLQTSIKLVMSVAITIMGFRILLTGTPWDKKTIMMFVIKLSLVAYFALGTAWQDYFYRGVTTASTSLAGIFMSVETDFSAVASSTAENYRSRVRNVFLSITKQNPATPITAGTPAAAFESKWSDCRGATSLDLAKAFECANGLRDFLSDKTGISTMNPAETNAALMNSILDRTIARLKNSDISPFIFSEISLFDADQQYRDGCQFPRYNADFVEGVSQCTRNGVITTQGCDKYDNPAYPQGKEYLQIWDMLDCKIARAMGFGPQASIPNLAIMILAGLITSGLGVIFFVATFIFAFYLISFTVRSLHIFLISTMAITLMVYISPITITACLFQKTNNIFTSWRTNLLGFVLQPIILFAYVGILITVFEHTIMGSAQFSGTGKESPKLIDCLVGNAANDSIYCIFGLNMIGSNNNSSASGLTAIGTNNALSPIGIAVPVLLNMNQAKLNTVITAAFLMFIFTTILEQIPQIAVKLIGGNKLQSNSKGAMRYLQKANEKVGGVTKRGTGMLKNIMSGSASMIKNKVRRDAIKEGKKSPAPEKEVSLTMESQSKASERPKPLEKS